MLQSTRNEKIKSLPSEAVLEGIAPDGGLYIPTDFEHLKFDWESVIEKKTREIAVEVLAAVLDDFPKDELRTLVEKAYRGKFETEELCPLVPCGKEYILELFRGPTSAFKDVALSMLPQLTTAAREKCGVQDEIVILAATSGDTGKAALEGFHDVEGTKIIVFYPDGGVSRIQRAQMVTQEGKNVFVCAIKGNFDDAQTGVKAIFAEVQKKNLLAGKPARLSSANSINIGRLAPQIVYYFKAYGDLVKCGRIQKGEKVNFSVPTGNFGNILAGFFAKKMGLPVGTLLCASNQNCVLTDFIRTGTYDKRRPFYKTTSPSMDILVSSNLERLLFLLSDGNAEEVAGYMKSLSEDGFYTVTPQLFTRLQEHFAAGFATDEEAAAAIRATYEETGYLCDPHTAVAVKAAREYENENPGAAPMVVLSTASPYKFSPSVLAALGEEVDGDEFEIMNRLQAKTGVPIPKNLAGLQKKKELHKTVIEKEDMLQYVFNCIEGKK